MSEIILILITQYLIDSWPFIAIALKDLFDYIIEIT